ncbi:malto-oligosyltrehalose synthase [Chitinophaga horti]|uniref:Malto-oligosyltrehalose synthase n=1 Tax=Chitinophaga horti TaxID=2920382 RepID=A0ABY6J4L9_9BACT|nr:malto-oligosyltrehalose synthase [Chitinophaga horti]UYQ94572.1 malto-oligosyltrehalose synthase [Chitinophaga horti]
MENSNINLSGATYRLQFNERFTFAHLDKIIDYLHQLGITTIYAAPIFEASPGSLHGYDVCNPHLISPAIGTIEAFREIGKKLKERGMTWLQDIVPNHMAFHMNNHWLADALERGPHSPYYNFFDIDWQSPEPSLNGKVMVPFLGSTLEESIEKGDIQLAFTDAGFVVAVNGQQYPLSLPAYDALLEVVDDQEGLRLRQLLRSMKDEDIISLPLKEWRSYKEKLFAGQDAELPQLVVEKVNQNKTQLTNLLKLQHYQFHYWRDADTMINYRRFFTVNELITLRMEDQQVFDEYHTFLHRLYRENLIQGLRIDHIDGLKDPGKYIDRLRGLFGNNCYIIAEKILEHNEQLPERWALQGSTGYEFLALVNQLLTDNGGVEKLSRYYRGQFPELADYNALVYRKKKMMLEKYMGGELERLAHYAYQLKIADGIDKKKFKQALGMFMVHLPVYRLYPLEWPPVQEDIAILDQAMEKAKEKERALENVLETIQGWWEQPVNNKKFNDNLLAWFKRVMQITGPLTAKGVEDTVFYVYNALISHNEVGDSPSASLHTPEDFHKRLTTRQYLFPQSLNATATHDTKRGEDARIRLNALTAVPDRWIQQVQEWHALNKSFIKGEGEEAAPGLNDEYFIYQSVLAGLPPDAQVDDSYIERVCAYVIKGLREGKVSTNWTEPDEAYETATTDFIRSILTSAEFKESLAGFYNIIANHAMDHSLSQTLIKLTAPGVPDIYQGCELWDLSFVDPDNRRDVDYDLRQQYLSALNEKGNVHNQLTWAREGRAQGFEKFYLTYKTLQLRKEHAALFAEGDYVALNTNRPANVIAYARCNRNEWAVVVAPLMASAANEVTEKDYVILADGAPSKWRNVLTGEVIQVTNARLPLSVLQKFPAALLVSVM